MAVGRVDEAITRLVDLIESPSFELYADSDAGRAAVFRLGDALAEARIYGPARGYLRRSIMAKDAWVGANPWARRAVRRLVDVGLQSEDYAAAAADLAAVPANAPEEVRGEIAYLTGRAQEAAGQSGRRACCLCKGYAALSLLGAGHVPVGTHRRRKRQLQGRREPPLQSRRPQALGGDDARFCRREVLRRTRSCPSWARAHCP